MLAISLGNIPEGLNDLDEINIVHKYRICICYEKSLIVDEILEFFWGSDVSFATFILVVGLINNETSQQGIHCQSVDYHEYDCNCIRVDEDKLT